MVLSTVTHAQTSVHMHALMILQNQIYVPMLARNC